MARYRIWDPHALDMYDQAGLTYQQRVFVQGLLRSLESGSYLSEHVSSAPSVPLALTRAHHAMHGYASINQPRIGLMRDVLAQSLRVVDSGAEAFRVSPAAATMITRAQETLGKVIAGMSGTPSSANKHLFADHIGALVEPAADAAQGLFEYIWGSIKLSTEVARRIRDEVAVLVVLEGRDGEVLRIDLLRLFARGVADTTAVADVLWPAHKQYRVALVVSGAQTLEGLDRFLPLARQSSLVGSYSARGIASSEVRRLVDPLLGNAGPTMLVVLPTWASDAPTAVLRARRDLIETIDQYAAGQRLLELNIEPRAVAIAPSNEPFRSDLRNAGNKIARPLTDHWPEPLRPALRMANLADRMDAPVASAMLAWSALESLGLEPNDFELLAKACALHSLRQQILSVYQSVTDSAISTLRFGHWRVGRMREKLTRIERSQTVAMRSDSRAAREAAARLRASMTEARDQLARAEVRFAELEVSLLPSIEIVRMNLLLGGNPEQPLHLNAWKLPLNGFLDAIIKLDATASDELRQTQDAVIRLSKGAGGLAEELLVTWQKRLADPSMLIDWLSSQQDIFHGLLIWMYASRNLAIHAGQFELPADVLTAQAGRGLVDMVLEFLGHWYQTERIRGAPDSAARAVLEELADRKDTLEGHLRGAASCHPLNVLSLTSPYSDCWQRS
jgi:hypothetical protein